LSVYVVDAMMGAGKTSAAVNMINGSGWKKRYLYITPYLSEVERIKKDCKDKNFAEPASAPTKRADLKRLLRWRQNIVSTHALLRILDDEAVSLIEDGGYTLVMDEVADVLSPMDFDEIDQDKMIPNVTRLDEETHQYVWTAEHYEGRFEDLRAMCEMGSLVRYGNGPILWKFPIKIFMAFDDIYLMTYLFDAQMQKYYYDLHGVKYQILGVGGDSKENYFFADSPVSQMELPDYGKLIHIVENEKMNELGRKKHALSQGWYQRNTADSEGVAALRRHCNNFFRNITRARSKDALWTTFKDFEDMVGCKGYKKGFLQHAARATNEYKTRTAVAYLCNKFLHPDIKAFFSGCGAPVDEDAYALSEMLQWIWRSAIRDNKEITLYVPSKRMRNLLKGWLEQFEG